MPGKMLPTHSVNLHDTYSKCKKAFEKSCVSITSHTSKRRKTFVRLHRKVLQYADSENLVTLSSTSQLDHFIIVVCYMQIKLGTIK